MRLLLILFRLIVGGVFIWAALAKIPQAGELAKSMAQFKLVPPALILPFSYFLPWLELFCGAALIAGVWLRSAAIWANALLVVFSLALVANLIRGIEADCGCFGETKVAGGSWGTLIKNLVLLPLGLTIMVKYWDRGSP